jgi:hypothetical protein
LSVLLLGLFGGVALAARLPEGILALSKLAFQAFALASFGLLGLPEAATVSPPAGQGDDGRYPEDEDRRVVAGVDEVRARKRRCDHVEHCPEKQQHGEPEPRAPGPHFPSEFIGWIG